MELLAIINVVTTLVLATIIGYQVKRHDTLQTYVAELEDENDHLTQQIDAPFVNRFGGMSLDDALVESVLRNRNVGLTA